MPGYISSTWNAHTKQEAISSSLPNSKQPLRVNEQGCVKGDCVICQKFVYMDQARDKLGNGIYRHHFDETGRCITETSNNTPIFIPPISIRIDGACGHCHRAVLNVQEQDTLEGGACWHRLDSQGRCITGLRHGVLQQLVLAPSLPVKTKGVCGLCMGPVTNMQQRERVDGGWQHKCDSENNCITSCALPYQQQRIISSQNGIKVKGVCTDCSGVVTSEQRCTKTAGGTWRHEQDVNGRCMLSSQHKHRSIQPVKWVEAEVPHTPQMEGKVKQTSNFVPTPAPEARFQILSMLSSPNCVELGAIDFLHSYNSSHNPEVY